MNSNQIQEIHREIPVLLRDELYTESQFSYDVGGWGKLAKASSEYTFLEEFYAKDPVLDLCLENNLLKSGSKGNKIISES